MKENLVELALDEILKNNGYFEKRDKSSRNYKTLTNDYGDTIVISRQSNGHYLYFNPNDNSDRGNIYNFAKNRGVEVKDLIDEDKIKDIKELQSNTILKATAKRIDNEIIEKFKKLDKTDTQGKAYDKPIKQLCNGNKGLEILKADNAHKSPKEFKNIIISESMIDTLSFCEMKGINLQETLLCSTNGQISVAQKDAIKALCKLAPDAKFTLAFDNDDRGKEFGKIVEQIVPNADRQMPILKDFNDDLVVGKALGLAARNISKENILKPLSELGKKVEYLSKKYDFLEPCAKNERVNELLRFNPSKFKEIAPKVQRLAGMRECFKRLDLVERKIGREYSRAI